MSNKPSAEQRFMNDVSSVPVLGGGAFPVQQQVAGGYPVQNQQFLGSNVLPAGYVQNNVQPL
jgi:hypothetical protein